MPKVSIVIGSYNHAAFVREAVESVLSQQGVELEVVITDDGSTDGTAEVVRQISDSRIHLHAFPQNQGACVAFNDAIRRARGPYIAVLNSDDFFLPGKLASQTAYLDEHPEIGAVFGWPQFVDERGRPFRNPLHSFSTLFATENGSRREWLRRFFYERNCLCHPTVMIRRECYDRIGVLDPLLMQLPDLDLWVRLCAAYDIHVLPQPLTAFRILDRERNTSAPTQERLVRSAWETAMVLRHYATLSADDLTGILAAEPNQPSDLSPKIRLALAAIRLGKPGYAAFGLDLLRSSLRDDPGSFPYREYFRLVGSTDPYGAEFNTRIYRALRQSAAVDFGRRALRWIRALNVRR